MRASDTAARITWDMTMGRIEDPFSRLEAGLRLIYIAIGG